MINAFFRVYILVAFVFIFAPIISLIAFSFANERFLTLPWPGFTTKWYTSLGDDPTLFSSFKNSLIVAAIVGAVATTLGAAAAYFLNRWQFRGKNVYIAITVLPPCTPLVVLALAMLIFLRRIGLSGSLMAVCICHIGLASAFAIAILRMRLTEMDRRLEEAAWNLGANEWRTIRQVVLPQLAPALVASFFLTMAVSWDEFVMSWFVSGLDQTLPVKIYSMIVGDVTPRINAIGAIVVCFTITLITLAVVFFFVVGRAGEGRLPTLRAVGAKRAESH
jgi:spermidine/putrescine transport system permease protein